MAPDAGCGLEAASPVLATVGACAVLVVLGASWVLMIALSEFCCCLPTRRRASRDGRPNDSADRPGNDSAAGPATGDHRQRADDDSSRQHSVQTASESAERTGDGNRTTSRQTDGISTECQRSEKKNVFHVRRENKKAATCQSEPDVTMKDRISAFETGATAKSGALQARETTAKPKKKKPSSKAFQEFEKSGIIIGFGRAPKKHQESAKGDQQESEPNRADDLDDQRSVKRSESEQAETSQTDDKAKTNSLNRLTDDEGIHMMDEEDEFSAVTRQSEILKSFRRAPPPKNRSRANRALQKRISTRRDGQSLAEFDLPLEQQDEESEGSVATTMSHSTDSMMTPSDRATPDNDTATSGHHTGEDSPRGTTPDTSNKDEAARKATSKRRPHVASSARENSPPLERREKHIILVVDDSAKLETANDRTSPSRQQASMKEVKEVSFNDFMALIKKPNNDNNETPDNRTMTAHLEHSSSDVVASTEPTPPLVKRTPSQTSAGKGHIQVEKCNNRMPSNQNNNNTSDRDLNTATGRQKEPGNDTNTTSNQLVLTRPRSFQPINFARIRDTSSPRTSMPSRNVEFPSRSRFSSVVNYGSQQSRSGAERSRSMSVGAAPAAQNKHENGQNEEQREGQSARKDGDSSEDNGCKSFRETAI